MDFWKLPRSKKFQWFGLVAAFGRSPSIDLWGTFASFKIGSVGNPCC